MRLAAADRRSTTLRAHLVHPAACRRSPGALKNTRVDARAPTLCPPPGTAARRGSPRRRSAIAAPDPAPESAWSASALSSGTVHAFAAEPTAMTVRHYCTGRAAAGLAGARLPAASSAERQINRTSMAVIAAPLAGPDRPARRRSCTSHSKAAAPRVRCSGRCPGVAVHTPW